MKKYDNYKDSNQDFLGKIPSHWFSTTLKRIAEVKDGTHDTPSYVEEDGIPFITTKDLSNGNISFENCKYISSDDYLSINKRSNVENGDIIMPMIGSIGSPIIVKTEKPFSIKNLALIKKNTECDLRYICYYLNSEATLYQFGLCTSGGVQNFISLGVLRNLGIPKMAKEEQIQIANFLDHKTTQIDTLISKKQQFITLLQEERIAVINQAVTKGLDPKVKMKDSGIEWLGEIPEHWEVKRMKYVVKTPLKYGANESAEDEILEDPRYIRITDFGNDGKLRKNTFKSLSPDKAENFLLEEGDILFARSGATVGKTFFFKDYKGVACFAGYLIKASCDPIIMKSEFLYEFTNSSGYENWKLSIFQQSTIQNIGADKYNQLKIGVPPLIEQQEIISFITEKTDEINILISKTQQEIELLKEYKTALISEVVTGKVDVRKEILN